jgi:hypothetical protein
MTTFAKLILAAGVAAALAIPAARAQEVAPSADDRLLIVDGASDQVIYDDGRDDLFCVTRVHGWRDWYGYRHYYRTIRCR